MFKWPVQLWRLGLAPMPADLLWIWPLVATGLWVWRKRRP